MSPAKKTVMISSTARDLPQHRKEVMDACLRQGMFPVMMEHLPANDDEAIAASLKMVDEADVYVGVFAHRYGYTPKGHDISVTEMEYNGAVERKIPRCIFVIDKNHPLADFTINDIDIGENAAKLASFKQRVETENIVNFFKSPADLRAHVINSLSSLRVPDLMAFHYVSDIPTPPEPFIAHPYTLLQTHSLVGRRRDLNLLTDWVAEPQSDIFKARILNIVAIGGMGKSALTWKWFTEIAPQEMKPMAGRMWWSFYESDATFENFVARALAYTSRRPLAEVERIPVPEREAQLLSALDREPFLIVLDGLERMLIGYARLDAAHLADDDYHRLGANRAASAYGLPASAAQSFTGEYLLRKTADPRAGNFLRKLANARESKIIVSTRLYPADLQRNATDTPINGCYARFLAGLSDDDALDLWRTLGVVGARDSVLPLFKLVDNHPLVLQSLAIEVARYRRAPGDYDRWRRDHPDFEPFKLPLVQHVQSHVLKFALRGLDDKARQALRVIAAFRMPACYDTLTKLLISKRNVIAWLTRKRKPCADEDELDQVLVELERRGLVGWDRRANRYDIHPIVRSMVWSGLDNDTRRSIQLSLNAHFEALPRIGEDEVYSFQDLTATIELYNTLIGLRNYGDALRLFRDRLDEIILHRLCANHQRVELLEMLFPDGLDQPPRLLSPDDQVYVLNALAEGFMYTGRPRRAATLNHRAYVISSEGKDYKLLSHGLRDLSTALRLSGALYGSDLYARRALLITREQGDRLREAITLQLIGSTFATRGIANESQAALQRSLWIFIANNYRQAQSVVNSYFAQRALWLGEFAVAISFADQAWKLAHDRKFERDFIRAARVQGEAALGLNNTSLANERLHHALTRARMVNQSEEELPALIALAELRRRKGELGEARELLNDVWDGAERGPYPLFHTDAFNVLAQIERDAGNRDAAVVAAAQAYRLAWCDGRPFAYHWGLEAARKHLRELGAPEPEMPPFDPSTHEPMPEVEIDPEDEFHIGAQTSRSPEE